MGCPLPARVAKAFPVGAMGKTFLPPNSVPRALVGGGGGGNGQFLGGNPAPIHETWCRHARCARMFWNFSTPEAARGELHERTGDSRDLRILRKKSGRVKLVTAHRTRRLRAAPRPSGVGPWVELRKSSNLVYFQGESADSPSASQSGICAKKFDAVERFQPSPPEPAWGATLRQGRGPSRNGNDDQGLRRCVRAKLATIRNLAVDV